MIIVRLQDHFPMRVTDWLLACILTSWGVAALFIDPATWGQPLYSGLNQWTPDVWALIAISIGLARMAALFINGAIRRSPHARAIGAFASCWVWWWLAWGMLLAEQRSFEIGIYPWLLFAEVYNVYRASRDARLSDDKAKAGAVGHAKPAEH